MKMVILFSLLVLCLRCTITNAAGTLTSDPSPTNGVLRLCPGVPLSITCSHGSTTNGITRWRVTGTTTQNCNQPVSHNPPQDTNCGPFTMTMVSDDSGSSLNSTALTTVPETLDRAMVECLDGGGGGAESVGIITIQVVDPTPSIDSVLYSVDTEHYGRAELTVSSPRAYGNTVTYSRSVNNGAVQTDDNEITATGLSYTQSFTINVSASLDVSAFCSGLQGSTLFIGLFNATELTFSSLTSSLTCSSPSLDILTEWTFEQGTLKANDSGVLLSPPLIGTPVVNYTSGGGVTGMETRSSSYTLSEPIINDTYTLTVSVNNAAGTTTMSVSPIRTTVCDVNESTVDTMSCLTVKINEDCSEDISAFSVLFERGFGNCPMLVDLNTTSTQFTSHSTCLPIDRSSNGDFCYRVAIMHQGNPVCTKTNIVASPCSITDLEEFLGAGVSRPLDSLVMNNETVIHLTRASLSCNSPIYDLVGGAETRCINGQWSTSSVMRSCTLTVWLIVVIIIVLVLFTVVVIVVVGIVCYMLKGGSRSNLKAEKLTRQNSSPPPPDSLYADPKSIEHQAAPGTEDQYAMVDRKVKKNMKPEPPPEALYQDPNTIEHETAASGDTYAMVDKPKRSSKKKGGPDVVPPASKGLTYADIDLSSKRPKPGSGRQAPQQPGEYPKEHPVEYSSVDHGNTSQL